MTNIEFNRGAINASSCVGNGWELIKRNYWLYFGICIIAFLIALIPLVNLFLSGPLFVGVYFVFLRGMRDEPLTFGMMFEGFNKFGTALVVGLIAAAPGVIFQLVRITVNISDTVLRSSGRGDVYGSQSGAVFAGLSVLYLIFLCAFVLFSIFWNLAFFFTFQLMAENEIGPIDAVKLSAGAAFSNLGGLIVLILLEFGITLIGALVCFVGVFFVLPLVYSANAFAYRQVFPLLGPGFQNVPPHPSAFGGGYGQGV